jgi:RNA polymerase sigma-70 factor, ECF subfamily
VAEATYFLRPFFLICVYQNKTDMSTEILWRETHQALRTFILSKVKDEQETDDILQEVFLKIQLKLPQLKDGGKVVPWLYQIARNAIADNYREKKKSIPATDREEAEAVTDTSDRTHEFAQCIPGMIQALPEKYREAVYLTEIEGLTQKELAERLGLSISGAKSRVQRGREKLKEMLLQCCEIYTDAYGNVIDYHSKKG